MGVQCILAVEMGIGINMNGRTRMKSNHPWIWSCSVLHNDNVTMIAMVSQTTSLTIVYSTVYLGTDERKHQSSASLAFVRGIHRWPVNSPHKGPVTRKMFPFDDVIMSVHIFVIQIRFTFSATKCKNALQLRQLPKRCWEGRRGCSLL